MIGHAIRSLAVTGQARISHAVEGARLGLRTPQKMLSRPKLANMPSWIPQSRFHLIAHRALATKVKDESKGTSAHFRVSQIPHPLNAKPIESSPEGTARLPNHVWTKTEIQERLENLWHHAPVTMADKVMHGVMWGLYKVFNKMTGYKVENTPVKAVEWRLIVLESFAGVPGFMAAMFRHFRSLRKLQRDHGWIHTLLEEAENERMHLLVCMSVFEASALTRFLVLSAQVFMAPWLAALYLVHPKAVHRFVGYLEETACHTYANIIRQVETPGTPLHEAWAGMPAPQVAKVYWKLPDDAMWVDTLKCMFADESNHRDVNHTFATMETDDPSPFVDELQHNAAIAWKLRQDASQEREKKAHGGQGHAHG